MQHKTSVQYTNQGDPAQEDTAQNKQNAQIRAVQRLKDKGKMTIRDSGDDTTGAPLTVEEATTASRLKSLKIDGQQHGKRKSFRDCQMKYLQRFNKYTKTRGVTTSSSELKPKRTCRQRRAGHMKEKLNNSD